ncbi:DUF7007 domain-containing protein [Catelliglobosispora koreensis]|uniref:DUF7007 domain-containing protein n=1 Tax=Catelliglobosispora koreensis TaxID=129052 RepID=UPI000374EE73|nr:hypothetical protein [Catelliglobosispora koreensis]
MDTPWGTAQSVRVIAEGIVEVTTASHGGIRLHPARNASVPAPFRDRDGWYEEDAEWAFVALTFAEFFDPDHVQYAHLLAARYYAEKYIEVYGADQQQQIMRDEEAIRARLAVPRELR